jgi:hypothetical protein
VEFSSQDSKLLLGNPEIRGVKARSAKHRLLFGFINWARRLGPSVIDAQILDAGVLAAFHDILGLPSAMHDPVPLVGELAYSLDGSYQALSNFGDSDPLLNRLLGFLPLAAVLSHLREWQVGRLQLTVAVNDIDAGNYRKVVVTNHSA